MDALLEAIRRFTECREMKSGVTDTAIPGLSIVRSEGPSGLVHAIYRPLVCLILQGSKTVTMGQRTFQFTAANSLIVTAETPTVSQITQATRKKPYLAVVIELEPAIVTELGASSETGSGVDLSVIQADSTEVEVADTVLRMVKLLDRPSSVPMLLPAYMRELHYWLLLGRHGFVVKRYAVPGGSAQGIGRAVAILHRRFAEPLSIRALASAAGMSSSSFHQRFREATASTPLQFQKQLRLIEARRLMFSEGRNASSAAFAVGYESVNQFTREYGRAFGAPPAKDVRGAKDEIASITALA
jgi:AraC-like DNA-binding protein